MWKYDRSLKSFVYVLELLLGRFEQAVESARETGATYTKTFHSKQPVHCTYGACWHIIGKIIMVYKVKRVASNHKMKCDTNIDWNASGGNIAKPGLTLACAWASACCSPKGGARKVKWCMCHHWVYWNKDHWNVSYVRGFHIVSSREVLETTSQHLNSKLFLRSPKAETLLFIGNLATWVLASLKF